MVGSIETSSATWMTGQIEGRETVMLLDTGSAVTLLSAHVWEAIKPAGDSKLHDASHGVVTADGSVLTLVGQANVLVSVGGLVRRHCAPSLYMYITLTACILTTLGTASPVHDCQLHVNDNLQHKQQIHILNNTNHINRITTQTTLRAGTNTQQLHLNFYLIYLEVVSPHHLKGKNLTV